MPFSKSAKTGRNPDLPGFSYDPKAKRAVLDLFVPGSNGRKRIRRTLKGVSRDAALEEWRKLRARLRTPPPAPTLTFRAFVETYWSKTTLGMIEKTKKGYQILLDQTILPNLGDLALDKVDTAAVRDLAAEMKAGVCRVAKGKPPAGGYAPSSVRRSVVLIRRILRDAVDRKALAGNPFEGKIKYDKPVKLKQELAPDERAAFLGAFDDLEGFRAHWKERGAADERRRNLKPKGERRPGGLWLPTSDDVTHYFGRFRSWKPLFVVALETGLRRGDLLSLKWSSVDLKAGMIRVTMSKTREEAVIPITGACKTALRQARFRRHGGDRVFPGAVEMTLRRNFVLAKRLAGIERPFRFHDLRHSFASNLASKGVGLQVIAKALGHTTTQMSERYARPDEAALRAAFAAVERVDLDTLLDTRGPNRSSEGGRG
jgi:integrase